MLFGLCHAPSIGEHLEDTKTGQQNLPIILSWTDLKLLSLCVHVPERDRDRDRVGWAEHTNCEIPGLHQYAHSCLSEFGTEASCPLSPLQPAQGQLYSSPRSQPSCPLCPSRVQLPCHGLPWHAASYSAYHGDDGTIRCFSELSNINLLPLPPD